MTTTAAELLSRQTEIAFYVRIDGIGYNDAGTYKALYIFEELPSYAAAATSYFVSGLMRPDGFSEAVPVMGGVGRSGGLTVRFHERSDNFFGALFATQRWRADPAAFPETRLTATYAPDPAGPNTMTVENTAGFPAAGVVFVGQDAVSYTGTTPTTFTGCAPGQFPSEGSFFAQVHRVGGPEDVAPVVTTIPRTFYRRRISLYALHRHPDGTWAPLSDALRLWTGRIRSFRWQGDRQTWGLRCDPILDDLDREVFVGPTAQTRYAGYWLGTRADPDRRISITWTKLVLGLQTRHVYTMTAASNYLSWDFLLSDLNSQAALGAPAAEARVEFEHVPRTDVIWARFPDTNPADFVIVTIQMGAALGTVFGLGGNLPAISGVLQNSDPGPFLFLGARPPEAVFYETGSPDATLLLRASPVEGLGAFVTDQGDEPTGEVARAYIILDYGEGGHGLLRLTGVTYDPASDAFLRLTCTTEVPEGAVVRTLNSMVYPHPDGGAEEAPRIRQVLIPEGATVAEQLLTLMKSTGVSTYNGAEDLLPTAWGGAIRGGDIDEASFRTVFTDTYRRYVFARPANLRDLIEQECRLVGATVTIVAGVITARRVPTITPVPIAAIVLDGTNTMEERERPDVEETADGFYNTIELKTRWNEAEEKWVGDSESIVDADSIDAFAQTRRFEIACRGIYGSPSWYRERLKDRLLLQREPYRRIERSITRDLWNRIAAGDVVSLADATVPDPFTGTFSGVARGAFVEEVRTDLDRGGGRVTLRLFPIAVVGPLAPSAMLDHARPDGGYEAAFLRLHVLATEFSSVGTDSSYFAVGDRILIVQSNAAAPGAPLLWRRIVTAIDNGGANRIDIDIALAGFDATQRYIVTFDTYTAVVVAQLSRGTWIADDADRRIGATLDHREWVD